VILLQLFPFLQEGQAQNLLQDCVSSRSLLELHLNNNYEDGFGDLHEEDGVQVLGEVKKEKKPSEALISPEAPYHSLDAGRLKLTGEGKWPMKDYLRDELWLPFVEPRVLHHGFPLDGIEIPDFNLEDKDENLKLALLWSTKGILRLFGEPPPGPFWCRVFNAYKNEKHDRQIGDRRLANGAERGVAGPSRYLPIGYMMTSVHCPPGKSLVGIVTDRKDFYHQAEISREKAHLNTLPFSYPADVFQSTSAYADLVASFEMQRKRRGREFQGDLYGKERKPIGVELPAELYPAFGSLYQGDHLGVEYALSSHGALLEDFGLLQPDTRVQNRHPFPAGPLWQGLVIDDFFAISQEDRGASPEKSAAMWCFNRSQVAYTQARLLGSEEKDIKGSDHFKVVGAEINSSRAASSRGAVTVGAPLDRRLSVAALSLRVGRLPIISRAIASRLAGAWTCILMYRRCLTCIFKELYGLGVIDGKKDSEILSFSRKASTEIVIASALSFVAISNVSADYDSSVYASDASLRKGAIVSSRQPLEIVKTLWLGGDKRGTYTRLDNPFKAALRSHGFDNDEDANEDPVPHEFALPKKGLDFSFDFVEVCGGAGSVSKEMASYGFTVCTPIELSDSPAYNLEEINLVHWILHMLKVNRFKSIMLEPPCTSFSAAAHPAVRSYSMPRGFDEKNEKTRRGNTLAFRCIAIAGAAGYYNRPCLLEQPFLSKMAWLSAWRFLVRCKGWKEAVVASCAFGSPHLKQFRLLTKGLDTEFLTVRCEDRGKAD